MSYIDYPIKCMDCGLHYTVHSWDEDWFSLNEDGRSRTAGGYCPECGTKGKKMLWGSKPNDNQIFEIVGETALMEMTPLVQPGVGHGAPTIKRMEEEGS